MTYDHTKVDNSEYEQLTVGVRYSCSNCLDFICPITIKDALKKAVEDGSDARFSRYPCELCGGLPGDRYIAHGLIAGEWYHLEVCQDCVMYIANGELPPDD